MNENTLILSVVAIIAIVVVIYKKQLKKIFYKDETREMGFETHPPNSDESKTFQQNVENKAIQTIPTSEAIKFYELCAEVYEDNNSNFLWETHNEIVRKINSSSNSIELILDLGGGTGRFIAQDYLNNYKSIKKWVNYDFCKEMLNEFEQNMESKKFICESVCQDILDLNKWDNNRLFDISILSFVLSSMSKDPDFFEIRKRMKEGGLLIIAEGEPTYTLMKGSKWPVEIEEREIQIELRPISLAQLINVVVPNGFNLHEVKTISKKIDGKKFNYSYIATFEAV